MYLLGHPRVPLPQTEHDVCEAAVALPRPLELEHLGSRNRFCVLYVHVYLSHRVNNVAVTLEDAGVLPPDVGRAEDEAAVVREDGGQ